ncbi:hypothetical protein EMO89_00490 [Bifidobacterium tissieri]|uniref:Uncharacterized protein n=1 Tax=Bifidobacterium tissieri TaxID=1630162 RepID=A0A5M9ZWT2_9BIFI|nr:hypothetical protein [Bifidobacterium tissieri]KAA8832040.1 hypothetical protein EMO89_00490 [Bifidobacterium tissieri]
MVSGTDTARAADPRDGRGTDARLGAFNALMRRRAIGTAAELRPLLVGLVNASMRAYLRTGAKLPAGAKERYRRCLVKARDAENNRQVARAIGKLTPGVVSNEWFVRPSMPGGYAMSDLVTLYRLAGGILDLREDHLDAPAFVRVLLRIRCLEPDEAALITLSGVNAISDDGTIPPIQAEQDAGENPPEETQSEAR